MTTEACIAAGREEGLVGVETNKDTNNKKKRKKKKKKKKSNNNGKKNSADDEAVANGPPREVREDEQMSKSAVPAASEQEGPKSMPQGVISISLPGRQEEEGPTDGFSKIESAQPALSQQGNQVTGAKRRKSGCVRRFKVDSVQNGAERGGRGEKAGNEDVDSTEDDTGDKNKLDECSNQVSITKIIKPVRYFASITNDVQEVSITFKALRSALSVR